MKRPDLSDAELIALDLETFDPGLTELNSNGVYRKDGYVLGFSLADEKGFKAYYNVGHKGVTEELSKNNLAYLKDVMALNVPKIGANILYDLDWIENFLGIKVNGALNDIQTAEPLLDEYAKSYSLNTLANKYLGKQKEKSLLSAFCERNGLKGDERKHLYLMPFEDVEAYGEADSSLPIEIFNKQKPLLEQEGVLDIYNLEVKLFPLLLKMRKNGVRIDRTRVEESAKKVQEIRDALRTDLWKKYGEFNYNSSKQIAEILDKNNVQYGFTPSGNPKLGKDELADIDHPMVEDLIRVRGAEKILNTFLLGAFADHDVNGRIHAMFYPLKQDEGGTVSGRFSSQGPNLQQIPAREEGDAFGTLCRRCFVPEEGCLWGKIDYSQIEYRTIAHYAIGPMSDNIRERYNKEPKTDYHQIVMDLTNVDRKTAKRLNFGMAYFMGAASMARKFHWHDEHAKDLVELYFNTVPFIKPTRTQVVNVARGRGYIRTILGRKARVSEDIKAKKKEYVMFNRLIQGTAADVFKKQMVDAWEAGIYEVLTPHLIVHDENGLSIPKTKEGIQAYAELKRIMEATITLRVPIIADAEIGPSWGEVEECNFEERMKEYT